MVSDSQAATQRIDVWTMRCIFNRARFYERMLQGEFIVEETVRKAPPSSGMPPGTVSKEVYYLRKRDRKLVVRVHQYEHRDGTIAASGRPDPKQLVHGGTKYRLFKGAGKQALLAREPHLRYREGLARDLYTLWRRVRCWVVGS